MVYHNTVSKTFLPRDIRMAKEAPMLWILVAVLAAFAVITLVELNKAKKQLTAALAPKAAKSFGLADLRAIAASVDSKRQGETLAAVLAQLGIGNSIANDYAAFRDAAASEQAAIAGRIKSGEDEIERIKARNVQLKQSATDLTGETTAVAALVANVA